MGIKVEIDYDTADMIQSGQISIEMQRVFNGSISSDYINKNKGE